MTDIHHQKASASMFVARGIGILLIIFGHGLIVANSWFYDLQSESVIVALTRVVYSFHVPLFFVLSGWAARVFSKPSDLTSAIANRFLRLLLPYFFFTFMVAGIKLFIPHLATAQVHDGLGFLDQVFLHPRDNPMSVLWFLYVMFALSVFQILFGNHLLIGNRRWFVLTALAIGQLIPDFDNIFAARDLLTYGLPFYLGYAFCDLWTRLVLSPPRIAWIAILLVPVLQFGLEKLVPRYLLLAITGFTGTVGVVTLSGFIVRTSQRVAGLLLLYGRHSMRVYLMSYFVEQGLRICIGAMLGLQFPAPFFILLDLIITPPLSMAIAAVIARLPFAARLMFGETPATT